MDLTMFKGKCLECGKEVLLISKNAKQFCSKLCESNYEYRKRFRQSPIDKRRTPEEVRKI